MTNPIPLSTYASYIRGSEAFHFTRGMLPKSAPRNPHGHDHFELFWLYHGEARHMVNGHRQKLSEGDVILIRPQDIHSLQGKGEETHFVNIIIPPEVIQGLATRHPGLREYFFNETADIPETYHLDSRELVDLSARAKALEGGPRTPLPLEAFLLTFFASQLKGEERGLRREVPKWLRTACNAAHAPDVFREGAAGLVRASGKGHAHVSRVMRKTLDQTPSDYVNEIRMAHAADRLVGSSDGLAEIAQDCGLENMSHFHRLFRKHHHMTPRAFRLRYQRDAIRPE